MYLGGNGLYAVASLSDERTHLLEVRRSMGSAHFGRLEPGEGHASLTGEPGGIWRHRGRAPQRLVGVGASAWGLGRASAYRRTSLSFAPHLSWVFAGLKDASTVGTAGPLGGAAGDELDRWDANLGSPAGTYVLASSRGNHGKGYEALPEDRPQTGAPPPPASDPLIRADMVLGETPDGGRIFSAASIAWVSALTQHDVSQITANVLDAFLSAPTAPGSGPLFDTARQRQGKES